MLELGALACAIYNSLGVGYKKATTRRELSRQFGREDRFIRDELERLRHDYAILNRDDGAGYYLPETTAEGLEDTIGWYMRQESRKKAITEAQAGALKFIRSFEGMENFGG